uniref:Uncharacterized protein n=1 Tax=Plectus sambesii TaxID=2011161 RepID=A0A914WS86_9BILA
MLKGQGVIEELLEDLIASVASTMEAVSLSDDKVVSNDAISSLVQKKEESDNEDSAASFFFDGDEHVMRDYIGQETADSNDHLAMNGAAACDFAGNSQFDCDFLVAKAEELDSLDDYGFGELKMTKSRDPEEQLDVELEQSALKKELDAPNSDEEGSDEESNEPTTSGLISVDLPTTKRPRKRKHIRNVIQEELLSETARTEQQRERERLERLEKQKATIEESSLAPNIEVIEISDDEEELNADLKRGKFASTQLHKPPLQVLDERFGGAQKASRHRRRPSGDLESTALTQDGRLPVNANKPEGDPDIFVADHLTKILQPHQLGGVRFMYDNIIESLQDYDSSPGFGCILAHSMGLGKTIQVITFTEIFLRHTTAKRVLIIVPINTIQNWLNEFDRFLPRMSPSAEIIRQFNVRILGDSVKTLEQRAALIDDWYQTGGVLLIGYEMFRLLIQSKPPKRKQSKKASEKGEVIDIEKEEVRENTVKKLRVALIDPGPDLVVCDEGHRIKTLKTEVAVALNSIRTRRRIVLTGYPLQNNLMEYYCMVDFVRPNYLGTRKEFANMFERPIKNGQCADSTATDLKFARQRAHVLVDMLKGFVHRRTHHLLRQILPKNLEYVLLLRKSAIQHELYRRFVIYCQSEMDCGDVSVFNPLKAFAACCKIWNHPDILHNVLLSKQAASNGSGNGRPSTSRQASQAADFDLEETFEEPVTPAYRPSPETSGSIKYDWAEDIMCNYQAGIVENGYKMAIALAILEEATQLGDKVLLFSQSLYTLDLIEKYLESKCRLTTPQGSFDWRRNRNYFRFDGSTSAIERERLISRFNNEPGIFLFLISTRAGSLGINLVSANRVIIFDASWNPCHDAQAVCRVYRYGQQKPTFIYRLICDNSMERAIFNRQIGKHGLSQRVVDDQQIDANLTRNELERLLVYDEALDVVSNHWDVTSWEIDDAVLWTVSMRLSNMFAQSPFLHETLMSERDEALSEQEKREAKELYENEKKMSMSRFTDEPYNGYSADAHNRLGAYARPRFTRPPELSWPFSAPPPMPTRVQFPLRAAHHPTKVLIPPWVGELVAAKLRIYRRQALATGRPILTSRINHGPKSHRDNGP